MPLFLNADERNAIAGARQREPLRSIYWALLGRVERRAATPGLGNHTVSVDWWHHVAEYLTDAAMARAVLYSSSVTLDSWLRDVTLSIIRRPIDDWVGPSFRERYSEPKGYLETAHLTWGIAVVLDLSPDLFTDSERSEIVDALRAKGAALCLRWLDSDRRLANWRCVLNAGLAAAAATLDDRSLLDRAACEFNRCVDVFQPDGSYGESLQYGNYAAYGLMIAREALVRRAPALHATLPLAPYVLKSRWDAASLFYQKPLTGWGSYPRPRSANFNDSAALYRPSADVLLHTAARARDAHPTEAGLARWLFDTLYTPMIEQGPHDLATFGFVNDFGFLTLPLFTQAAEALTPQAAGVSLSESFSCGDILVRDAWPEHGGRTILAVRAAGEPLRGPGHLHGDLNSFILAHNRERLLLDPGHSCYRNILHDIETSSFTHNTCTFSFEVTDDKSASAEDSLDGQFLQQSRILKRHFDPDTGISDPPIRRGGSRLICERRDDITVIASEVADLYGAQLKEFTRFWFLCGSHALFIVDRIAASHPTKITWNWLLNNRDNQLNLKLVQPDRAVARRGSAGVKLFHLGRGLLQQPRYAYVHDAYHPLSCQLGEGRSGSGVLLRWIDSHPTTFSVTIHAIAVDDPGAISGWHLKTAKNTAILEAGGATAGWRLFYEEDASRFEISNTVSKISCSIAPDSEGHWRMVPATFIS